MEEKKAPDKGKRRDLEAILFAAGNPVPFRQIGDLLGVTPAAAEKLCGELAADYAQRESGIRLQVMDQKAQLTTAPEASAAVEGFLGMENTQKLSRAALETLTIVAYRQPVSRPAIEQIRGVGSDYVIRVLLNRGLIAEVGRAETPGRPILFGTTQDFLLYFGLSSIDDLPPFEPIVLETNENAIDLLKE